MISWIQDRLIKNGKWIFSILLAVIIVSFVFVIGETPGITTPQFGGDDQYYYGVNLRDPDALEILDRQTTLVTMMRGGSSTFSAQNIRQLSYFRAAALHLADQYKVPVPDKETLQDYILEMPLFQNQQGEFNPDAYQQFVDSIGNNPTLQGGLLDRAIQDEYRIAKVSEWLSDQGFVVPYDVQLLGQEAQTRWSIKVAIRKLNEFQPEIEITDEALNAYFENNKFQYETTRQRLISWIYFPAERFLQEVADPGDEVLLEHLEAYIYRFLDSEEDRDPEDPSNILEPEALLAKRRDQVLADWRKERADSIARIRAEDFATSLYDEEVKQNSDEFKGRVDALGLETGSFNPIARDTPPRAAGEGATWDILRYTRGLNTMQWFTDAIEFREGYGIFYLTGIEEPEVPPLSEIRDQVESDFREAERRRRFNETAVPIASSIRENLDQGMDFDAAVARSSLPPVKTVIPDLNRAWRNQMPLPRVSDREFLFQVRSYDDVSQSNLPPRFPEALFNNLKGMEPGEMSDMITVGRVGYFLYVLEKDEPQLLAGEPDYEDARNTLEFSYGNFLLRNAMNELLEEGFPDNLQNIPGL